ncbi:nucleotide-binding universal stress UspA family protein [Yoonia maricola]|uniref:Nucleotide-binding universal stress UspA family protein n=1 Tax=Yoonia maricola TaxID=420999 RepID=A0A2M8WMD3_9RHOB|nr:universal stress protein [Yoonia maricola]PJI92088.1 nucleotide-binding universal stress UspA family protein [Yoonia maricola]
MTLRTILVCLTSTSSAADVLKSAANLARRDNAHVIGFYVTESLVVYPGIAVHIPEVSYQSFIASQKAHAQEMKEIFDAQMQVETFPSEWRQVSSESGFLADSIIANARNVDLVVMAQEEDGEDRPLINNLAERVIKESGRPVLVIPRDYVAETLGETVLLGWSDTREATRAMHDMLGVVSTEANLRVLRIGKPPGDTLADFGANDLAIAIARHGPKVEIVHRDKDGQKVPGILSHEAFEMGADMLITGAFGHSRVYDFVIGAATRDLLRDAKLPVMFSK